MNCKQCQKEILSRRAKKFCSNACQARNTNECLIVRAENGEIKVGYRVYRNYLIAVHGAKCMRCGWEKKNPVTKKVPIEMSHKDGNPENTRLVNLELLCPNCHSLTPSYKALNKGNGRFSRRERYATGKSY